MAGYRETWIQLFAAAVSGVAAGSPNLTDPDVSKKAGKIADSALKELQRRDGSPEYEKLFAGPAGS
jgi:hypothetical protein